MSSPFRVRRGGRIQADTDRYAAAGRRLHEPPRMDGGEWTPRMNRRRIMQTDDTKGFDNAHLQAWWAATRYYLCADLESLPRAAGRVDDGWPPAETVSHGGRKRFIARARGRLLRSLGRGQNDDPLREE